MWSFVELGILKIILKVFIYIKIKFDWEHNREWRTVNGVNWKFYHSRAAFRGCSTLKAFWMVEEWNRYILGEINDTNLNVFLANISSPPQSYRPYLCRSQLTSQTGEQSLQFYFQKTQHLQFCEWLSISSQMILHKWTLF